MKKTIITTISAIIIAMTTSGLVFAETLQNSGKIGFRRGNIPMNYDGPVIVVSPEIATRVELSNHDVNRITCQGGKQVKDVIVSKEKNILKVIQGSNAYVKFGIMQDIDGKRLYRTEPAEMYVLCGDEATNYTIIGIPKNIDAQQIQLSAPDESIKKNISLFEGIEFEKKIITIIKQGYLGSFPDSYKVTNVRKKISTGINGITAMISTVVNIDGEGLRLKIINLDLDADTPVDIREKMFLKREITDNPIGIAIDYHAVKKGRTTRLFILEQPKQS
jgi:conjugal transfer pilus assembly protein TraK